MKYPFFFYHRPHKFRRAMAKKGSICFFFFSFEAKGKNVGLRFRVASFLCVRCGTDAKMCVYVRTRKGERDASVNITFNCEKKKEKKNISCVDLTRHFRTSDALSVAKETNLQHERRERERKCKGKKRGISCVDTKGKKDEKSPTHVLH